MRTATLQRLHRDDSSFDATAARMASQCATEEERAELAAYLYLLPELSLERIASVFAVDLPRARRLIERGSGPAPITTAAHCRGWALVAPQGGRTTDERAAAQRHTTLCRSCRNRLRAHQLVQRRVAKAGSATFGIGVAAAIARTIAGAPAALSAAGVGGLPVAVLGGALAVTAGAGALLATHHVGPQPASVIPVVGVHPPASPPARDGGNSQPGALTTRSHRSSGTSATTPATPAPAPSPAPQLPIPTQLPSLPGDDATVPLPNLSRQLSPLPTDGTSAPAVPLPSPSLPLPLPTISLSPPSLLP